MSEYIPALPVLKFCNEHCMYVARESSWPLPQVNELAGCQNAQTRTTAGVSMEKDNKKINSTQNRKKKWLETTLCS